VTDGGQTAGRDLVQVLSAALQAGVRAVQLREKTLDTRDLCRLTERLLPSIRAAGARLLINDRADVALALHADGVHLTRRSLPPAEARRLLGPDRLIGVSCHSVADVADAAAGGADFVVFGPVYETPSKLRYGPPVGLDSLRRARALCPLPLLAIGGITADRVAAVMEAGADGVAAISAVLSAADPAAAAGALLSAVAAGRRDH
jgi:thiamine-phosphate pyrophosphorylase